MQLELSIEDGDHDALAGLRHWLVQEPELRGAVTESYRQPIEGEMGPTMDLLLVAVGSGGAITALISSLQIYLSQPRRSDVRIHIKTDDGAEVEVNAERVADAEALVRTVLTERLQ